MRTALLVCALLLSSFFVPSIATAQVTCGSGSPFDTPRNVAFTASPDHNVTQVGTGVPIVSKYLLTVFKVSGGTQVGQPVDLGKPSPVAGVIGPLQSIPQLAKDGTLYCLRVDAVGPGGTGVGTPSGPFVFPPDLTAPRPVPTAPTLSQ